MSMVSRCVLLIWLLCGMGMAGAPAADDSTPWSESEQQRPGLPGPGDWQARWIGNPFAELPIFRRAFTLADQPVKRAVAFVCGLGISS